MVLDDDRLQVLKAVTKIARISGDPEGSIAPPPGHFIRQAELWVAGGLNWSKT